MDGDFNLPTVSAPKRHKLSADIPRCGDGAWVFHMELVRGCFDSGATLTEDQAAFLDDCLFHVALRPAELEQLGDICRACGISWPPVEGATR